MQICTVSNNIIRRPTLFNGKIVIKLKPIFEKPESGR